MVIDKPRGPTSMDVVEMVRRSAGGAKTGHAGTLDPLATGVLVVAVGSATKHINLFMATDKRYEAVIDLSAFTTTDDVQGERTEVTINVPPDEKRVRDAVGRFAGSIMQRPPAFSAVKVGGKRAYKLARKGSPVTIVARPVMVNSIEVTRYAWPEAALRIHCAKGFYVRSLARDLGEALGTGGHCASIRRTAVGPFTLALARRLDDLPKSLVESDLISVNAAIRMLSEPGG